ncbi:redox-regulated HSP33 family molecular chaperone [Paenibacillus phyllosphaerae]|uniref:Redox-regulated HSP33 family molecular chaperone n=1 Tax=Paenibacillus phyllosphaerae TaxID=274593 RepID=A0A7W5AX39_9BACL|nr:redox-regulated HSP33 family molecular chaperone [Paenibacillus phyllosphaerae]
MILAFKCECGNHVDFHAFGDRDEHGRQWLELEDDERIAIIPGKDGFVLKCNFCKETYRISVSTV